MKKAAKNDLRAIAVATTRALRDNGWAVEVGATEAAIAAASKVEATSEAILEAMHKAFSAHSRRPVNLGHYFMSNADQLARTQIEGGQFR